MIQFISALLAGAFLLTSCGNSKANTYDPASATHVMCVDSFDKEASTIAIYFDTAVEAVPKIQHITHVSKNGINQSIAHLGMCQPH